nr:Chain D, Protein transport protein SEC31 [Saccharomyces cerevisiae]
PSQPPINAVSGQTPHLNRKANDGWNDLPLKVKEKPSRAKAVSVAPPNIL